MTSPPILTEGPVILRPLSIDDAEDLFAAHGDPDVHLYWAGPAHPSVAYTRDYIEETLERPTTRGWSIRDSEDGPALGRIAIFQLRDGVGEIGLLLRRDAQGRGLGKAAVRLVERFAFEELDFHRITADADPANAASCALFDSLGYEREGLLRGNWKTHLGVRDSVVFGKLRP